jgi:hypothetical protein
MLSSRRVGVIFVGIGSIWGAARRVRTLRRSRVRRLQTPGRTASRPTSTKIITR